MFPLSSSAEALTKMIVNRVDYLKYSTAFCDNRQQHQKLSLCRGNNKFITFFIKTKDTKRNIKKENGAVGLFQLTLKIGLCFSC